MSLIDQVLCWLSNKYEEFTHWYWHKSPHHVRCRICGEKMRSDVDKYSPEECGWKCYRNGSAWICHRCDCHRDFRSYVKLVDLDEQIRWDKENVRKHKSEKMNMAFDLWLSSWDDPHPNWKENLRHTE